MSTPAPSLSFFVKVEGNPRSNHRSPRGVYGVDVKAEKTLQHSACAALNIARDQVHFLEENAHCCTMRVFNSTGDEIVVPRLLHTVHDKKGMFRGRVKNPPARINDRD